MNIILLSGGSGKRLWPLSNDIRSKQFIKIFKKPEHDIPMGTDTAGDYESMIQRVYRQIKTADPDAVVTIATNKYQVSAIHNQLGTDVGISVEPCRKGTFPAMALAAACLHEQTGVPENEAIVVCPVDPYVDEAYFRCVEGLYEAAKRGDRKLVLMGIQPTYPSEKYGYIRPAQAPDGSFYFRFTEKPAKEKAAEYIEQGALWNGGVFACRLDYILEKAKEILGTADYSELLAKYAKLEETSFDKAVVEQETSLEVLRYSGMWKDLGTWNTLSEAMEESFVGEVIMSDDCSNVHVINETGIPVLVMGMKNTVISASPEGILVSDKEQSSYIQPYVDAIDQQIMFAEKSWGSYRVLDVEEQSMTVKVTLNPGHSMNYHSHEKRDEVWTVIAGSGQTIVDGRKQTVGPGDVVTMPAGCKHTVTAGEHGLQLIEVQRGTAISVADKKKYDMP